jgi:hypothetical protein
LDSAATAGRWIGNRSKLFGAGNHLDFLLLAARDPGDYFRHSGQRQSCRR